MSVANLLENLEMSMADRYKVANKLTDFYMLYAALDTCRTPMDTLMLLKAEVLTKNRKSYKERIISRYSKLRMLKDLEELEVWAKKKGQ